jgi:hypothetical protein
MRKIIVTSIIISFLASATAMAAAAYTTEETPIGDLLDNPATQAVVAKYLPDVVKSDQIDMARGMTLRGIQQYSPDIVTDEVLTKIDAELSKLPPATP